MAQGGESEETLGEMLARLIDSAKAYAKAEARLARETALAKLGQARPIILLAGAAILLVNAALIVLVAALGMLLAVWIGPAAGLAAAALAALIAAGLLGWLAILRITGDRE